MNKFNVWATNFKMNSLFSSVITKWTFCLKHFEIFFSVLTFQENQMRLKNSDPFKIYI